MICEPSLDIKLSKEGFILSLQNALDIVLLYNNTKYRRVTMLTDKGTIKRQGGKFVKGKLFAQVDETASVAKETSSAKQSFNRIRDIQDMGGAIKITLNKITGDDRDSVVMPYAEACKRLATMKKMAPIVNLQDAKAFVEILELLEARLQEVAIKHGSIVGEKGFVKLV